MQTIFEVHPGCWENWSSPLQAHSRVNWGITGGKREPLTRPYTSRQWNTALFCKLRPSPSIPPTSPLRFTQLLSDWLRDVSIKVPVKKKTLASRQHYKTNYGARRLSRFKVPFSLQDWLIKTQGCGDGADDVGGEFQGDPHPSHLHADYIDAQIVKRKVWGRCNPENTALFLT